MAFSEASSDDFGRNARGASFLHPEDSPATPSNESFRLPVPGRRTADPSFFVTLAATFAPDPPSNPLPLDEDEAQAFAPHPEPTFSAASFARLASSSSTALSAPQVAHPIADYYTQLHLVGRSGSGKSSLRLCLSQSTVLKTLPDVTPSQFATSTAFHFRPTTAGVVKPTTLTPKTVGAVQYQGSGSGNGTAISTPTLSFTAVTSTSSLSSSLHPNTEAAGPGSPERRGNSASSASSAQDPSKSAVKERLLIEVVDTGPHQLAGLSSSAAPRSTILLTFSLATVKQKKVGGGFLSRGTDTVIVHSMDVRYITSLLMELSVAAPGSNVFFVGTHMDVLSERSVPHVELILKEFRRIVTAALEDIDTQQRRSAALRPNRSLSSSTAALMEPLRFLGAYAVSCDSHKCVPENRGGPVTIPAMWRSMCETMMKEAKARSPCTGRAVSFDRLFAAEITRVTQYIKTLRATYGLCLVPHHQFLQALFIATGASHDTVQAVIRVLVVRGELVLMPRSRHFSATALIIPTMPSRVLGAIKLAHDAIRSAGPGSDASPHRAKFINVDECLTADPHKELSKGFLVGSLISPLSQSCATFVDSPSDRRALFVALARRCGFMFPLRDHPSRGSFATPPPSADVTASAESNAASLLSLQDALAAHERFAVPSLVPSTISVPALRALQRDLLGGQMTVVCRRLSFALAPSGTFGTVASFVGHRCSQRGHVYRDALWFPNSVTSGPPTGGVSPHAPSLLPSPGDAMTGANQQGGSCRCLLLANSDVDALPGAFSCDFVFVSTAALKDVALFVREVTHDVRHAIGLRSAAHQASWEHISPHEAMGLRLGVEGQTAHAASPVSPTADSAGSKVISLGRSGGSESVATLLRLDLALGSR